MPTPITAIEKVSLLAVVVLSLAAIAFSLLAPGFSLDNSLVYGAF